MSNRLPPLNAVRIFEAAARNLSFAKAAEELGVTQSAISKQIASLEDFIGARLFERSSGGVSLTLEGRELQQSISPAFEALNESFQRFSRKAPRSRIFRLATVASFAAHFLVPRLAVFKEALPDIELEILTADRVADLNREEIDLSIRYGAGTWDGLISTPLNDGALLPICAPQLFTDADENVEKLFSSHRRIQVFLKNEWRNWEKRVSTPFPDDTRPIAMEHFMVAAKAVLIGHGLALLPEIIVRDHLAKGDMVQFSEPVAWDQTFHAVHLPNADRRPIMRDVLAWLKSKI